MSQRQSNPTPRILDWPTATGPRPRAFNLCCSYFLCNCNSRFNLATVHLAYMIPRLPLLPNLALCSRRPNFLHNPSIIASPACLLSFVLPTRYFRLLYTIHAPCLGSTRLTRMRSERRNKYVMTWLLSQAYQYFIVLFCPAIVPCIILFYAMCLHIDHVNSLLDPMLDRLARKFIDASAHYSRYN